MLNHNTDAQIGVVESAKIDSDRKGRATVRFSRSPLGDEIFQDVKDGIRRLVSVGYIIHETRMENAKDGLATVRATKWEPSRARCNRVERAARQRRVPEDVQSSKFIGTAIVFGHRSLYHPHIHNLESPVLKLFRYGENGKRIKVKVAAFSIHRVRPDVEGPNRVWRDGAYL